MAKYTKDHDNGKRIRVVKPYTPTWHRMAYQMLQSYVTVRPCVDCGGPVHERYCCGRCGCTDPDGSCRTVE